MVYRRDGPLVPRYLYMRDKSLPLTIPRVSILPSFIQRLLFYNRCFYLYAYMTLLSLPIFINEGVVFTYDSLVVVLPVESAPL